MRRDVEKISILLNIIAVVDSTQPLITNINLGFVYLSGRSPKAQTLELMEGCGFSKSNPPPHCHAFNVTVPGAAACWCDTVTLFGSKKVLYPHHSRDGSDPHEYYTNVVLCMSSPIVI